MAARGHGVKMERYEGELNALEILATIDDSWKKIFKCLK